MVDSGGEQLVFASPFESAKLNIGDYSGMNNIGGQFPLGEVFTEAQDLEAVNGRVRIFVFGDTHFMVNRPDTPITLIIDKGRVTGTENATPEFDRHAGHHPRARRRSVGARTGLRHEPRLFARAAGQRHRHV